MFSRPVPSVARGASAITRVASSSFPTGVQTSHSFCMNLTYILKDGVCVILSAQKGGVILTGDKSLGSLGQGGWRGPVVARGPPAPLLIAVSLGPSRTLTLRGIPQLPTVPT